MKTLILLGTLLLAPTIALANVETQTPPDINTLITNIAKSNLSENEKAHLIESYIQSRTLNTQQVIFKENNYRHQNYYNNHRPHCNGPRGHWW